MGCRKIDPYEWIGDNLKLSETVVCHISHHVNNPLAILMARIKMMPDGIEKNAMLHQAERIRVYIKSLRGMVQKGD